MVCRAVTLVSPVETAEAIEMPLGLWARIGPRSNVLDGATDPPMGRGNFGGKERPIVKYRDTLRSSQQKSTEPMCDAVWTVVSEWPKQS